MSKGVLRTPKNYAKQTKINIDLPSDILEIILRYALCTTSDYIQNKHLSNLLKLLESIDETTYENDRNSEYQIIIGTKFILRERIENNIKKIEILLQLAFDNLKDYEDYLDWISWIQEQIQIDLEEDSIFELIDKEEILFVNNFVQERLTYINIFKARDQLLPLFKQIDSIGVNLENLGNNYTSIIENLFAENMKVKKDREEIIDDFQLLDKESRNKQIDKIIDEYNKPNNKLNSGIKMLNKLLNGGWENGRFYLIIGLPKSWKSGTLLNICMWTIKYNKLFALKNPNKRPAVFYLTQENSTRETINRMYVHLTGKSIKHLTKKEAKKLLRLELAGYDVDFFIRYRATRTISTLDFDNMITEIETENNCEVILAVQDYTKRIRSSNPDPELRIELARVADDFCSIAKRRNIPIISGAQLNRDAYKAAENAIRKGHKDIAKNLSPSQIGESVGLIENADYSLLINKESISETEDEFLSIRLFASRDEAPPVDYFVQKFENGMKLQEDFDLAESLSYESIGSSMNEDYDAELDREKISKNKRGNKVKSLSNKDEDNKVTTKKSIRKTKINPNSTKKGSKIINSLDNDDNLEFDEDE